MTTDPYKFDTIIGQSTVGAHEVMAYAEDDWRINDHFKVNLGLNLTGFNVQGKFYPSLQPRLSGRYLINDKLSAKVGYAYMTQYLHLLSNSSISLPTDLWVPVTARIKPMTSQQVAAGLFYNLMDSLNLSVEGYYKYMDNLLEYKDGASFWGSSQGWEHKVCMGRGWAYGVEFLAQKNLGRLTGWLGYTWSHTYRLFDRPGQELNDGKPFPAKYDRRHDISLVLTYKFTDQIDASISWVFSSGNAATLAMQEFDPSEEASPNTTTITTDTAATSAAATTTACPTTTAWMSASTSTKNCVEADAPSTSASTTSTTTRTPIWFMRDAWTTCGNDTRVLKQLSIFPILPSISYNWTF